MKIVPIEINFESLYDNRHLFSDDVKYNSLIVSNILNTKLKLLDIVSFINLDDTSKMEIFKNYNTSKNYYNSRRYYKIISHHNIYDLYGPEPDYYGYWEWDEFNKFNEFNESNYSDIIDVLVIL